MRPGEGGGEGEEEEEGFLSPSYMRLWALGRDKVDFEREREREIKGVKGLRSRHDQE